jgi:hypothetical protein
MMLDVIEHVVRYERLHPMANCPCKMALWVAAMMDGPDRKKRRHTLTKKHSHNVILEPTDLQNEKDDNYEYGICRELTPNPSTAPSIR